MQECLTIGHSEKPQTKYRYYHYGHGAQRENPIAWLRTKIAPYRFGLAAKAMVKEIGLRPDQKMLEIGCGVGLLGDAIKQKLKAGDDDFKYYGVDISHESAVTSSKKSITAAQANAEKLPYANESFERIVSTDTLEHIKDADELAKEIWRVLKPGGKAFIVIADPGEPRFNKTPDHIDRDKPGPDVEFWENMFVDAGFKIMGSSKKYRKRDHRRIFNLPILRRLRDKSGFACAFNPVYRPGVYILSKPEDKQSKK